VTVADGVLTARLHRPASGVAAGQAIVAYRTDATRGDAVLGSATITAGLRSGGDVGLGSAAGGPGSGADGELGSAAAGLGAGAGVGLGSGEPAGREPVSAEAAR
jgi:hypothetical protein